MIILNICEEKVEEKIDEKGIELSGFPGYDEAFFQIKWSKNTHFLQNA